MLYLCHCKFISMCLCLNSVWAERKVACLPFHYVSPPSAKWEWRFVKRTNLPSCSKSAVLVRWHHCGSLSLVKTVDNDKQISCFYLKGCFVNNVFVGSHRSFWTLSITLKNQSFGETRKLFLFGFTAGKIFKWEQWQDNDRISFKRCVYNLVL